jgi:hypothetical protein
MSVLVALVEHGNDLGQVSPYAFFYLRVLFLTFLFVRSFFTSQIYISVYGTDVREAVIFFGADFFEYFGFAGWIIEYQHSEIQVVCRFLGLGINS